MIQRIFRAALAAMLAGLCLLVAYQVFARYIPFIPPFLWTEEIARLLFMWMVMIGAGYGFVEGTHFSFNFLIGAVPAGAQRSLGLVIVVLTLAVMIFFAWSGYEFFLKGFRRHSLVTGLPQASSYAALPVGALIGCVAICVNALRMARGGPLRIGGE
ncbi:TRAP transporter small permease [Oceaniglobus trochenteri]|uniref:TRAP transporter small permease n=1 Tax=Oceaniglobus trochenteri TaxID=2763260 RepID=UPI001CFFADBE|nr:TRAP transporter small permease [Oceaniglobus trochenteri]